MVFNWLLPSTAGLAAFLQQTSPSPFLKITTPGPSLKKGGEFWELRRWKCYRFYQGVLIF
jgi:hypothetical protein